MKCGNLHLDYNNFAPMLYTHSCTTSFSYRGVVLIVSIFIYNMFTMQDSTKPIFTYIVSLKSLLDNCVTVKMQIQNAGYRQKLKTFFLLNYLKNAKNNSLENKSALEYR